jgi:hypothetical protein
MAKPFQYDEAIGDEICERLLEGESLRTIAKDEHMPAASTIFKWLVNNEDFAEQYARAKEAQADVMADEIVDIADGRKSMQDGCDPDVNRDRLSVDARKWVAAKLKPKKYGDKIDVTTGGEKIVDDVTRATRLAAIFADIEKRDASD